MAHFAYTGPEGTHCGECAYWDYRSHYEPRFSHGGAKPSPCAKFTQLMNGMRGASIEWLTPSCKYFQQSPKPFSRLAGL